MSSTPAQTTLEDTTFALAYKCPHTHSWYYIPTDPEARKWRGPFRVERELDDAINAELGEACTVTVTTVSPNLGKQTDV